MKTITIKTSSKESFINITSLIQAELKTYSVQNGICTILIPHTTAGITLNENADHDVISDMLMAFDKLVPSLNFRHMEGNSKAHIKSSLIGCSLNVIIENGSLMLGTWQGIYFCEFDGPRTRKIYIHCQKS